MVEGKVSRLSEGLPKEADDANMAEPVAEVAVYRAEFVLPAPSKAEESKEGTGEGAVADATTAEGEERAADSSGKAVALQVPPAVPHQRGTSCCGKAVRRACCAGGCGARGAG
jgi:hypothetical protein